MQSQTPKDLVTQSATVGLREFKNENYSKALKIFARGISSAESAYKSQSSSSRAHNYHPKYTLLLDCRAACFEKLDKLPYALIDSERTIKLEPYSCKGYLRTSKILSLMGKDLESYQILTEAVQKIESGKKKYGQRLKINENLLSKVNYELNSIKEKLGIHFNSSEETIRQCKDPIQKLPFEIIITIFRLLDQRKVLSCLTVSKLWCNTISSVPQLLESPLLKKPISLKEFNKFLSFFSKINRGRKNKLLKELSLRPRSNDEYGIVKCLFTQQLIISKFSLTLSKVNNTQFDKLLSSSSHVRKVFNHIEELNLCLPVIDQNRGLNSILQNCQSLQSLTVVIGEISSSTFNNNNNTATTGIENSFEKLGSLAILFRPGVSVMSNIMFMERFMLHNSFPILSEITLVNCCINLNLLSNTLQVSRSILRSLRVESIPELTLEWLFLALQGNDETKLQRLEVKEIGSMTPQHLRLLQLDENMAFLSKLSFLRLVNTTLTFEGFMKVVRATRNNLTVLQLIANGYLVFKKSPFDAYQTGGLFLFSHLLEACPNLVSVSFVQCLNLADYSLKMLSKELMMQHRPSKLAYLDLSSNDITGVGLLELFQNPKSWLRLRKLTINGCNIHPDTVKLLIKKNYCVEVEYLISSK